MKVLLDENLKQYKANLHCHSTISDGQLSPETLKGAYMAHGYSIIAYTDHDIMLPHEDLTDSKFVALHGMEMTIDDFDNPDPTRRKCTHLCMIQRDPKNLLNICWHRSKYIGGFLPKEKADYYKPMAKIDESLPDYERAHTTECLNDMIRIARENGFFVTYNHPSWSLDTYEDYSKFQGLHAFEICNYGGLSCGIPEYNPQVYDQMLRCGQKIFCVAADDNHNFGALTAPNCDSFGGFTNIFAEELTYSAVMDALFAGHFYASQGPAIYSLTYEDGKAHIKCSPCKLICMTGATRKIRRVYGTPEHPLTEATFEMLPGDDFFRITVYDEHNLPANTNAYFIKDLER